MPEAIAMIQEHFGSLADPRSDQGQRHHLFDILVIALCATICGADGWTDVEIFGHAKEGWLRTFLELPHGIPSHDTFGRVFRALDPETFRACFLSWMQALHTVTAGEVVALDGKQLRGSHDHYLGKQAIYMVSAWATANELVLGQTKVAEKSNEITAIPQLLQVLDLNGCIVTTDAMGCQRDIAQTILDQGGDYMLALKENQGNLYREAQSLFEYADETEFRRIAHDTCRTVNKGHGRIEVRTCWIISEPEFLSYLQEVTPFPQLRAIVKVQAKRQTADEVTHTTRYFVTSLAGTATQALKAVRSHWKIENQLHWVLDVTFREDASRVRKDHGPENAATLRHIALNLLKQEKTNKRSIKAKRLKAALSEDYLLKVLTHLRD